LVIFVVQLLAMSVSSLPIPAMAPFQIATDPSVLGNYSKERGC
jgi:hypothetical protein